MSSISGLYDGLLGGICSFVILCYSCILYFSSGSAALKTLYLMMHERRVLFIIILLGILFYIDNKYFPLSPAVVIFPIMILAALSLDLIVTYFPRRLSLAAVAFIVIVLLWNTFNYSFYRTDCESNKLRWGIFGRRD